MDPGRTIVIAGALLAAGFLVSLVATRLRLPALVLFLGLGMAIGTDGAGWIDFASHETARFIGVVALAVILCARASPPGSAWCWGGPGCAVRCRSSWPPLR